MRSARGPGSSSCGRRACGSGGRSAEGDGFEVEPEPSAPPRDAYIGVRSCDLHAIASLDSALRDIPNPDPGYAARRANVFIVALNCWQAGGTCFCVSMGTGPRATSSYDVALTEVLEDGRHYFLVEPGSDAGRGGRCRAGRCATPRTTELAAGERAVEQAVAGQGRTMDTTDLKGPAVPQLRAPALGRRGRPLPHLRQLHDGLPDVLLHERRGRDRPDRNHARSRCAEWDSCFTMDFSYVHGGSIRSTPRSRYRQWMTHKLATWGDQFDTFGCVGLRALHHLVPGRDRHHRGGGRDPGDRQRGSGGVAGGRAMKTMDALIAEVPAFGGSRAGADSS